MKNRELFEAAQKAQVALYDLIEAQVGEGVEYHVELNACKWKGEGTCATILVRVVGGCYDYFAYDLIYDESDISAATDKLTQYLNK